MGSVSLTEELVVVTRLMSFGRALPNVKFLVDDIESEWAYESNLFDFVHARNLTVSIKDFPKLIKQCYRYATENFFALFAVLDSNENRSIKPGGWVEFQDFDGYPHSEDGSIEGTAILRYYNEVYSIFEKAGYETRPGIKLEQWFKDAGFVNIHMENLSFRPASGQRINIWSAFFPVFSKEQPSIDHVAQKRIGARALAQAEEYAFERYALAPLTRYKQWTKEEVMDLARRELTAEGATFTWNSTCEYHRS